MNRSSRRVSLAGFLLALGVIVGPARGQESWDAIYLGGAKVGHMHVLVEPVKDKANRSLVRVRVDWDLAFKRGADRARMRLMYGTIETPDGAVLRLDTRTQAAEADLRTFGDVKDGTMKLTIESGGKAQEVPIPWGPDVRGPYAAELSLSRKPMKPGESREIKTYVPDLNKVCLTKLTARATEPVPIGQKGETRNLLRVEQVVADASGTPIAGMASTLWVEESGQIMKSHTDMLGGMDTYRTTKAGALGEGGGEVKLLDLSIIPTRKIDGAERTRDVVYRITMENDEPTAVFPKDRRQSTTAGPTKTVALIEVKTAGPNVGDAGADGAIGVEYVRSNPLVNSDDSRVIENMKKAVGRETDPWAKAVAIQKWVSTNIRDKNFATAFASAAEVAKNLRGDCSEHSVLVAAMCRAAGVPARCVVGVVYAENIGLNHLNGFGPHMWNEVFVNGRWVAIDAAYNQSEVDATHLKLSTSSLDGVAPFEAFLPVLKVFNKIKIEPVEVR